VGLIVLAPSPDRWCTLDCRLLAEDEGVCVRCAGDRPGERDWFRERIVESGVAVDAVKCAECCLEGGWKDFAFALRVTLGSLGTPVAVLVMLGFAASVSRRLPLFSEGARPS
jgi:hypothetical protein